ncbi:MAG: hypothetical protein VKK42_03885 [Lyngbya sp.]|nr:hypothetical protein [Lyngbya sp.]
MTVKKDQELANLSEIKEGENSMKLTAINQPIRAINQPVKVIDGNQNIAVVNPVLVAPIKSPSVLPIIKEPIQKPILPKIDRAYDYRLVKGVELIKPVPALNDPIRSGDYWLWPDPRNNQVFFSLAVPYLRHFSITIQQESTGGTIKITGGDAILEVNLYADDRSAVKYKYQWIKQLAASGYGKRIWDFEPIKWSSLTAALQIDSKYLTQPPQVTKNLGLGMVTFLISLSETGVQIWKNALENSRGDSISGSCVLKPSFYAQFQNRVGGRPQEISVRLGELLSNLGPEVIVNAQLQLSAEAKFLVDWHDSLENVVINWKANNGTPPGSRVFNQDSSPLSILLTAQDLNTLEVDWNATINFKDPLWPPISEMGKLSFANNNFSYILKPSAWVQDFQLIVSLLDKNGNIISSDSSDIDLNNRVIGMLNFIAPYLDNPLMKAFETSSQQVVKVSFPVKPGQIPKLALSIIAQRGGQDDIVTRELSLEENLVVIKVYSDAKIDIITNQDRVSETSLESEMLEVLAKL